MAACMNLVAAHQAAGTKVVERLWWSPSGKRRALSGDVHGQILLAWGRRPGKIFGIFLPQVPVGHGHIMGFGIGFHNLFCPIQ